MLIVAGIYGFLMEWHKQHFIPNCDYYQLSSDYLQLLRYNRNAEKHRIHGIPSFDKECPYIPQINNTLNFSNENGCNVIVNVR